MKKLITTFALAFCTIGAIYAQITYETTYRADTNNCLLGRVKLNQNTTKYLAAHYYQKGYDYAYNVTYTLYNLDHSLYKTLPVITDSLKSYVAIPLSIQENLFNTDANIEIAYVRYQTGKSYTSFKVIDENGTLIFERDSVNGYNNAGFNSLQYDGVFNTQNGTKLILSIESTQGGNNYWRSKEIYSLGGSVINSIIKSDGTNEEGMIELSPNPSKEYTRITYQLPPNENSAEIVVYNMNGSEIKRYTVDKTFSDLIVSNNDLPSGNYFYTLVINNQLIGTKKSFVIK